MTQPPRNIPPASALEPSLLIDRRMMKKAFSDECSFILSLHTQGPDKRVSSLPPHPWCSFRMRATIEREDIRGGVGKSICFFSFFVFRRELLKKESSLSYEHARFLKCHSKIFYAVGSQSWGGKITVASYQLGILLFHVLSVETFLSLYLSPQVSPPQTNSSQIYGVSICLPSVF